MEFDLVLRSRLEDEGLEMRHGGTTQESIPLPVDP